MRISSWQRQGRTSAGPALAVLMVLSACSGAVGNAQTSHPPPAKRTNLVVGARAFLYVVPAVGGIPRPLLGRNTGAWPQNVSDPAWSPDGRRIAFAGGCVGCRARLYVVRPMGCTCGRFPPGRARFRRRAGPPMATTSCSPASRARIRRIYSVNLRSGRIRLVHDEPEGLDNTDSTPSWSPDGRQIAFAREIHHERQNLWVIPATGGSGGRSPGPASSGSTIPAGHRTAGASSSCRPCRRTSPGTCTFSMCGRGR